MAYEQKDNSGSLFKNDKKGNDKAPDYKGKCIVDGVEKEMAAWLRTSKGGVSYMSFSFSEPYKSNTKSTSVKEESGDAPF